MCVQIYLSHFEELYCASSCEYGLQDFFMAKEFDFGNCLARFGLDWTKAKVMTHNGKRIAKLKGQSNKARLKEQKQEHKRVAKLKEQKQKGRAIKHA